MFLCYDWYHPGLHSGGCNPLSVLCLCLKSVLQFTSASLYSGTELTCSMPPYTAQKTLMDIILPHIPLNSMHWPQVEVWDSSFVVWHLPDHSCPILESWLPSTPSRFNTSPVASLPNCSFRGCCQQGQCGPFRGLAEACPSPSPPLLPASWQSIKARNWTILSSSQTRQDSRS